MAKELKIHLRYYIDENKKEQTLIIKTNNDLPLEVIKDVLCGTYEKIKYQRSPEYLYDMLEKYTPTGKEATNA
jgi:hypothetical protein